MKRKKRGKHLYSGSATKERPMFVGLDALSVRMISLWSKHDRWVGEALDTTDSTIERETFRLLADDCTLTRETSIRVLKNWMTRLETKIAEIAATDSKFFWLQLVARIPPKNVFEVQPSTVWLYRQTLKLAVVKYGADSGRQLVAAGGSSKILLDWALNGDDEDPLPEATGKPSILLPSYLTRQDVADAYTLERLAARYYLCTSGLRMVWKGGSVVVKNGRFGGIDSPKGIEEMYDLYDKRNQVKGVVRNVGSLAGTASETETQRFPVLIPYLNVHQIEIGKEVFAPGHIRDLPRQRPEPGEGFVPNYWIGDMELKSLCRFMTVFDDELRARWGCSGTEICSMLGAVGSAAAIEFARRAEVRWQLAQRGYSLCPSYTRFEEVHWPLFGMVSTWLSGTVPSLDSFRRVFKLLTYRDFASINLWDREGWRPFLEFELGFLIDHSALMFIPETMLAPIARLRGTTGRKKGHNFEDELRKFLRGSIDSWCEWKFRERIHFRNHFADANGEREIDLSFVHADCLFIVSCKAAAFGRVLDRGEGKAIWRRFEAIQGWLQAVDEVVNALADEPEGRDYVVPPNVHWIVALCCSPHVDYFPVRSAHLFLTNDIPRVCVPEELVEFIGSLNPASEARSDKSWLHSINR